MAFQEIMKLKRCRMNFSHFVINFYHNAGLIIVISGEDLSKNRSFKNRPTPNKLKISMYNRAVVR